LPLRNTIGVGDVFGIFAPEQCRRNLFPLLLRELWWHCGRAEKDATVARIRSCEPAMLERQRVRRGRDMPFVVDALVLVDGRSF
jgi:hypothetical protein